jgi:hypothetical protein
MYQLHYPVTVQDVLRVNIIQTTRIFVIFVTLTVPNVHMHPLIALYVHLVQMVNHYTFSMMLNAMQYVPSDIMDLIATVYNVLLLVVVVQYPALIVSHVLQHITESLDQMLALQIVEMAIIQTQIQIYVHLVQ